MECYACSNEAARQCRRCSRLYCEVHGGDLCAECLSPASSLPSFNLYRGSLLALLVGTAIAIWLLVRPPGSGNGSEVVISQLTPSPIVTEVVATGTATPPSTPDLQATAGVGRTPAVNTTPTPRATQRPQATDTPAAQTYVVQSGDTLYGIADQFAPPGVDPVAYAAQIAAANNLGDLSSAIINPGQTLVLP